MAVDTAKLIELLRREDVELLDNIGIASQHLVEIERLVKDIKSVVIDSSNVTKKVGGTETAIPGKAGELGAHLLEFNRHAKKIFSEGVIFVNNAKKLD